MDVSSTVSEPSDLDPRTTLALISAFLRNTSTPVPTNTPIDPTKVFKNTVNKIVKDVPYLTASMYYQPEMVPLELAELHQEPKVTDSTYQTAVPHPRKYLLCAITAPLMFFIRNLQKHLYFLITPLNHIDPEERATNGVATHRDSTNAVLLYTALKIAPRILPPEPNTILSSKSTDTDSTGPTAYSHILSPLSAPSITTSKPTTELTVDLSFETPPGEQFSNPPESSPPTLIL